MNAAESKAIKERIEQYDRQLDGLKLEREMLLEELAAVDSFIEDVIRWRDYLHSDHRVQARRTNKQRKATG